MDWFKNKQSEYGSIPNTQDTSKLPSKTENQQYKTIKELMTDNEEKTLIVSGTMGKWLISTSNITWQNAKNENYVMNCYYKECTEKEYKYHIADGTVFILTLENKNIMIEYKNHQVSYPSYKFITEQTVIDLCQLSQNKHKTLVFKDNLGKWEIYKKGMILERRGSINTSQPFTSYYYTKCNGGINYHMENGHTFCITINENDQIVVKSDNGVFTYDQYKFV